MNHFFFAYVCHVIDFSVVIRPENTVHKGNKFYFQEFSNVIALVSIVNKYHFTLVKVAINLNKSLVKV